MNDIINSVKEFVFDSRQKLLNSKGLRDEYKHLINKLHIDNDNFVNDFARLIDTYKTDVSNTKPIALIFWNFIIQLAIYFTIFYLPNKITRIRPFKILVFIWTYIVNNIEKSVSFITTSIFKILKNIYHFGHELVIVIHDVLQTVINVAILTILYQSLYYDLKRDLKGIKTEEARQLKKLVKKDIIKINKGLKYEQISKYYKKHEEHTKKLKHIIAHYGQILPKK